jgi:hypothetical protein
MSLRIGVGPTMSVAPRFRICGYGRLSCYKSVLVVASLVSCEVV